MTRYNEAKKRNLERLEMFVPIVDRVHGEHHPEFHEVRRLFDLINKKIREAGTNKPELGDEFRQLREVTDNYTVPDDVCESYEAVYMMLADLDEAYHS
ncbi:MAG TPA: iron-sulfur cluster repair di-iron protein, ric [Clostridiales bacterium]|jgi:iron-sulfur cluster repair protein YtfE (RIC family)|nr:iron-sulfur cluster repair di-iron protein, ric [Clostridiales bacterium]